MTSTINIKVKLKRYNPNPNSDPYMGPDISEEHLDDMHDRLDALLSEYAEVKSIDVHVYKWEE